MKTILLRVISLVTILSLVMAACTRQPQLARIEEITSAYGGSARPVT